MTTKSQDYGMACLATIHFLKRLMKAVIQLKYPNKVTNFWFRVQISCWVCLGYISADLVTYMCDVLFFFGWPSDSHVSVCFLSTQCEHTLEMRQSGREVSVLCLGCCLDLIGVLLDHKMNSSRNSWFSPFATAWQFSVLFCFVFY